MSYDRTSANFFYIISIFVQYRGLDLLVAVYPNTRERRPSKGQRLFNFREMLTLENLQWKESEIEGYGGNKRLIRYVSTTSMKPTLNYTKTANNQTLVFFCSNTFLLHGILNGRKEA